MKRTYSAKKWNSKHVSVWFVGCAMCGVAGWEGRCMQQGGCGMGKKRESWRKLAPPSLLLRPIPTTWVRIG